MTVKKDSNCVRSIRIPQPLWERVEARARAQGRTATGQVRWELEQVDKEE